MDALTAFGLLAVTAMLIFYAFGCLIHYTARKGLPLLRRLVADVIIGPFDF